MTSQAPPGPVVAGGNPLEVALRRDRAVLLAFLGALGLAAWTWVLAGAGMGVSTLETTTGSGGIVPWPALPPAEPGTASTAAPAAWDLAHAGWMLAGWWGMMTAMMLPGAVPAVLAVASVGRRLQRHRTTLAPAIAFACGYLGAWGGFSLAASAAQFGLERAGLLAETMQSTSLVLSGLLLAGAGLWQLTPLKRRCLRHCRAPSRFLARNWRNGRAGGLLMGLHHGAYCLGCCWLLMALLFYGGMMNLAWIGGLSVYIALEKVSPAGDWLDAVSGWALVAWALLLLVAAL